MEKYTLTTSCRSVHVRSYVASRGHGRGGEVKRDDILQYGMQVYKLGG